ncbi:hypothetical protein [Amycolatopsis sp. NPDC051903]|uniref:hypothetical protein n=1 Tax=Amycolatopsis sp. NPDC051903 TaxID=3363936 RepID=UPI0037879A02
MGRQTVDEHGIENHPDLMDPDWQRHAEKEAWIGLRRSRRRAHLRKRVTISAAVLVGLAAAGFAFYTWGRATSEQYSGAPAAAAAGSTSSVVTTTATAPTDLPLAAHVDLTRPFDGTPAQNWAEGIAGLSIPPAKPAGSFSAQQVGQAEDEVKRAITLAQFDQDTLEGHKSAGYTALFAPDARADLQAHADSYVTFLADGYHLLPVQPRMTGTMTTRAGKTGELVVHVAYVVAYAFDPGTRVIYGPADLEPFVRVDADYVVRSGSHWDPKSRGLWLDRLNSYFTSIACTASKTDRLAPAFSEPDFGAPSLTEDPGQFDPSKPIPTKGNCGD